MSRTLLSTIAVLAAAFAILLGGCGGGGGGGTNGGSDGGGDGGGDGTVRAIDGTPLAGATVKFYGTGSNTLLGSGVVSANGSIPAAPAGATRFSVDASALDGNTGADLYWTTYGYNGTFFDDSTNCYAPLPNAGSSNGFTGDIVFLRRATSPPPPPPTGCVG